MWRDRERELVAGKQNPGTFFVAQLEQSLRANHIDQRCPLRLAFAVRLSLKSATLIALALSCSACSSPRANVPASRAAFSPDQVVRQFYDWYFRARYPNPNTGNRAQFTTYVTQKAFNAALEEWDAVFFIDAQDADPTWADNFSVSEPIVQTDDAKVRVTLSGQHVRATLRVRLRRENGAWKIDDVKRTTWKPL